MLLTLHNHPDLARYLPGLAIGEEVSDNQAYADGPDDRGLSSRISSTRSFRQDAVVLTLDSPACPPPTGSSKRFSRHPGKPTQSLHPLAIIDTPGVPATSSTERQLALEGLEQLLERRMADKLNLELQIERSARRSGKEEDGLIHLGTCNNNTFSSSVANTADWRTALYLIDPVSILSNAEAIASSADVFDFVDEPARKGVDAWKPQLRQEDVAAVSI